MIQIVWRGVLRCLMIVRAAGTFIGCEISVELWVYLMGVCQRDWLEKGSDESGVSGLGLNERILFE
jgi:hypothetical protein